MAQPIARLTPQFLARVADTGLSDAAIAAAIGISPQFYSQVKNGEQAPSVRFMSGAVLAGLALTFAEVAEVQPAAAYAA